MTDREADDRMRQAFQSLAGSAARECSDADLDRIWRAVIGELPAPERLALIDRMAAEPALAEAWRLAHAIRQPEADETVQPRSADGSRATWWSRAAGSWTSSSGLAAAAVLVLALAALVAYQMRRPADDEFRGARPYRVESLMPRDTALPRDTFRLQWTPAPEGSRYHVTVTTDDLQVLADVADLTAPELLVDPSALSAVPAGARELWQVEVMLPDGVRVSSPTFVLRMR